MSARPQPVTVAAILMALFSLMNFPGPWWYLVPGAVEATPMSVIYSGIVLGIVGIVAAGGLWMMKRWGLWLTIVVCVINILFNLLGLVMAVPAFAAGVGAGGVGFGPGNHPAGTGGLGLPQNGTGDHASRFCHPPYCA